jgi:hypothetical protein
MEGYDQESGTFDMSYPTRLDFYLVPLRQQSYYEKPELKAL